MYKGSAVTFSKVDLNMGFWQKRQQINREVTVQAVLDRFRETGRFAALRCDWVEGQPNRPHIFYDSDVAKWMEAVAYLLEKGPAPEYEAAVEEAIDLLERQQTREGYINSYFNRVEPAKRWQNRQLHELYCAGHLMEAAVAWKKATGRDRFLKLMCRYADYIEQVFMQEQSAAFLTPGHEEIELALVKMFQATGEQRYLNLSKFFIDKRGNNHLDEPYWAIQSLEPCRKQRVAIGHAVRAGYLYSGMADIARESDDEELKAACEALFDSIVSRRMYITGGIGSNHSQEAFTVDYDLPNETAYAETCAAISLAYFAHRMLLIAPESKYADAVERVLYNGFLSGVSLAGDEFFYTNPLEINLSRRAAIADVRPEKRDWLPITQRVKVFSCSCCPPNVVRFIASIADFAYTEDAQGVYVHQYMGGIASLGGGQLTVTTQYPAEGDIVLHAQGMAGKRLRLRIPGWCRDFTLNAPYTLEKGYAVVNLEGEATLKLHLDMPPQWVMGNPAIVDTAGKVALMRGPVVYCLEGVDNGSLAELRVKADSEFSLAPSDGFAVPVIQTQGWQNEGGDWLYRPLAAARTLRQLTFVPYFAFANRGETDMRVWVPLGL